MCEIHVSVVHVSNFMYAVTFADLVWRRLWQRNKKKKRKYTILTSIKMMDF